MNGVLDLRRLRVVQEIAQSGSFSAAAQRLNFSPSAVSQQVAALERQLDLVLFERGGTGVRLTEAGVRLVAHADLLLAQASEAEAELAALARAHAGRLHLGSFPTATSAFAARAAQRFRERHPGVDLVVQDGEPFESVARLVAGSVDLALVFAFENWPAARAYDGTLIESKIELDELPLLDDPFVLLLSANDELAGLEVVELERLAGRRVSARAPWSHDFELLCRRVGFQPRLDDSHQTSDFLAYQGFVAASGGLTLIPRLAVDVLRPGLAIRPLSPSLSRRVSIIRRAHRPVATSATTALVAIVRDVVDEQRASPQRLGSAD